jgi:HEPN domain-containing protein
MLRRARTCWEQSRLDRQEARRRLKARAWLESRYFSFQASINALTCVCLLHGRFQVPSHSAVRLAGLVQELDARFSALGPACQALEGVQDRGPYDEAREETEERAESRDCFRHSEAVRKAVRGYLREHRQRFFSP